MAVAVKTPPGARSTGTLASPALISLVGVLYLLGCLGIVFKLLPSLWWAVWDEALHLQRYQFVGGSLLALVGLAVGVGLLVLGSRLLGPHPPDGVRAGVFVAFAGFLIVLGLARWASVWLEHWAYDNRWFPPMTGSIIAAVVGVLLLIGWIRLFTRPAAQKQVLVLEHGGWFHATPYKSNQGQKVRRGTVFGILLLVAAGIYTLVTHGTLRKGSPDMLLNIPFTGAVAVESFGDTPTLLKEHPDLNSKIPPADMDRVEIRSSGEVSHLQPRQIVSFRVYRQAVDELLKDKPELKDDLDKAANDPLAFLVKQSELTEAAMKKLIDLHVFREDVVRKLNEVDARTSHADLTELVAAYKREAEVAKKADELGPVFRLPTAVAVVNRYALRDLTDVEKADYVKILVKGDSSFNEGQIVSRQDFDAAVDKLEAEKKKGRDRELPQQTPLQPMTGKTVYASITLLPSMQFSVPLLLLAASLWLAWRIVNMPTFADFLIATEAELNKVSWTTQKRLVQDTVVVLVTVALMAVFLFGMDWTWKVVLSSRPIGVLHIPKDQADTETKLDNKRW